MENSKFKPGDRVRLKSNPSREGIFNGEVEESPSRRRLLIRFFDGEEDYFLEGALERVESQLASPRALILAGRFGRVEDLRGAITFYRLTGRLANLIYSLETTNTEFLPYQFKPVLQFLDSPCRGVLIADEVGLGKTIEAGLIWTELRARDDARRLLVICPAMLTEKWRDELSSRFGITAEICSASELLKRLKKAADRPNDPFALIASHQGLRPTKDWDDKEQGGESASAQLAKFMDARKYDDPLFDLVIVDEAHYMRNPETQTNLLGRLIRPVCEKLVLLSATPVQLHSQDLFQLLNLLDEHAFPYQTSFQDTLQANAPVVNLRDKLLAGPMSREEFASSIDDAYSYRIFEDNAQLDYLKDNLPGEAELRSPEGRAELAERLDRINPLAKVICRTRKRDVQQMRVVRHPVAFKAGMSEVERAFYEGVTAHVRAFCERYDIATGFMLTVPQRQMSSSMAAACRGWMKKMEMLVEDETVYEAYGDNSGDGNGNENANKPARLGTLLVELVEIIREIGDYDALRRSDTKYSELLRQLRHYWQQYPDGKIVLFSFYRETLRYLKERLDEDGIKGIVLQGGLDKQAVIREFADPRGPQILLSSEVASEGVDLQFSSLLINYDLPWNPMKIEQRIGRIDRIGQQADRIVIWNLMYADTIDERVYDRLLDRLDIFKAALGSIEAMLGHEIREMSYELLRHQLTAEQEKERIDQTTQAIANQNRYEENLEEQASQLIAHGEYIHNKVKAAREMGRYVSGEDLYRYVRDYLDREFPGCRFVRVSDEQLLYEIDLSIEARVQLQAFIERERSMGRSAMAGEGGGGRKRQFLFENRVGALKTQAEVISQYHPIVRFVSEKMRKKGREARYFPVVAARASSTEVPSAEKGVYVYAVSRWSVSGAREIERLEYCAKRLDSHELLTREVAEVLVNTAAMKGKDWLGSDDALDLGGVADIYDELLNTLETGYQRFTEEISRENADRISLAKNVLERHRQAQTRKLAETLELHRQLGRTKLIPATEGNIRRLNERIDEKLLSLQSKQEIVSEERRVSCGVICIE
ncbi:MAG: DEAD/DEAH box helicase [Zoogloeaceae bacterium]|nr:DEAD/DEAH box helicase [Zoogloeaceae bacterium]